MNLADARTAVIQTLGRMNSAYGQPVFNEWILVKVAEEEGVILGYDGPRPEKYQARFKADVIPLQQEMAGRNMAIGDFEFVPNAHGAHFDACLRLGPRAYLFCNHTTRTMTEIRKEALWLAAQKPFLELATKVRSDPLE